MRRGHFTALRPVCPRCRLADRTSILRLDRVLEEDAAGNVNAGILHCDASDCRLEFPIIDGIPIIVPDVAAYLSSTAGQILRRQDLPDALASLIGDALGPASEFDTTRQHLSLYCQAHYGDGGGNLPAALTPLLATLPRAVPALDLGCSVGGATFALAAHSGGLTLGVDLNFAMLQAAQAVLRGGPLRFDRRRVGLVYERCELEVPVPSSGHVDFWACDLLALPLAAGLCQTVIALNVLDCVGSPRQLLEEIGRILGGSGAALVASPYDWSLQATAAAGWIGGHSDRAASRGDSGAILRGLLAADGGPGTIPGLRLERELGNLAWNLQLHDRAVMTYVSDTLMLRRS